MPKRSIFVCRGVPGAADVVGAASWPPILVCIVVSSTSPRIRTVRGEEGGVRAVRPSTGVGLHVVTHI